MSAYEFWRVQVEYTAGVWTDVTADVDTMTAPVQSSTGTTPEESGAPGSMSLVLHNPAFKYTPGNPASAFALTTGLRIRFFEIILDQYVYHFTGFIEFPEIDSVNLSMTQDQTIQVSAVDQLSLWERSQTFVSTLAAHILYNAAGTLRGLWTFADSPDTSQIDVSSAAAGPIAITALNHLAVTDTGGWPFQPQSATPIPADDLTPGLFDPVMAGSDVGVAGQALKTDLSVTVSSSTFTVAWWMYWDDTHTDDVFPMDIRYLTSSIIVLQLVRSAGTWQVSAVAPGSNVTFAVRTLPVRKWTLCALRMTLPSGLIEFWVDRDATQTGTMSGAPPASATFQQLSMGDNFAGAFAYVQLYLGSTYTNAVHQAQFLAGYSGLERQTTGDRIKTLGRYAGLTDGQLVQVDPGQSIMQAARLAGLTVAQAMYEARDTEQGDLYVDGPGLLTFADRETLLNI